MSQKYWLADNGVVRCLDDRCPQECDMECPIYLNTIALECLQADNFREAAIYLEKAVKIEPTFGEAWNNLAACYGLSDLIIGGKMENVFIVEQVKVNMIVVMI